MPKKILVVSVLDESGSMAPVTNATIDGYNQFLLNQKYREHTRVTSVMFNDSSRYTAKNATVETALINRLSYQPNGSTALYDAVGSTILDTIKLVEHHEQDYGVVFLIVTDGHENASRLYTRSEIQKLIQKCKAVHGWEFVFLGANIDVEQAAQDIGIDRDDAVPFETTDEGVNTMFKYLSNAVDLRSEEMLKDHSKKSKK